MPFVLPPQSTLWKNDIGSDGFPECLDRSQNPPQPVGENLTISNPDWTAVLNGGNSIIIGVQTAVTLTSNRTFNAYVGTPTSFLNVNRLFITVNGVIKSLLATSVNGNDVHFTIPSDFFPSAGTYNVRVYDTTGDQNNLYSYVTGTIIVTPPPYTPLYLGNATVTNTGDFYLAGTIMTTNRFPVSKHELVPRAYVDSYIKSVTDYYDGILEPEGALIGLLDRVSALEAQLERVYQVIWSQARDVSAIVTAHAGAIVADYATAEAPNPALIANHPAEPTPQNILNFTPV